MEQNHLTRVNIRAKKDMRQLDGNILFLGLPIVSLDESGAITVNETEFLEGRMFSNNIMDLRSTEIEKGTLFRLKYPKKLLVMCMEIAQQDWLIEVLKDD